MCNLSETIPTKPEMFMEFQVYYRLATLNLTTVLAKTAKASHLLLRGLPIVLAKKTEVPRLPSQILLKLPKSTRTAFLLFCCLSSLTKKLQYLHDTIINMKLVSFEPNKH